MQSNWIFYIASLSAAAAVFLIVFEFSKAPVKENCEVLMLRKYSPLFLLSL
jgi:hypothetical protein